MRGLTVAAHEAVLAWKTRPERWPMVPLLCSYYTEQEVTTPVRLSRASKLYKLLRAPRRARRPEATVFCVDETVDLRAPGGLDVRVFLALTRQAEERDPITGKSRTTKLEATKDGRVIDPDAYSVVGRILSMALPRAAGAHPEESRFLSLNLQDSVLSPRPSAFSAKRG
jgi:hypothetical protein